MRLRSLILGLLTLSVLALAVTPASLSYVTTDSMEPTISPNDMYLLVPVDDPEPGDIITFRSEAYGGPVTHRIIGETGDGYLTQGDANQVADQAGDIPPVSDEQIVGKVFEIKGQPLIIPDAAGAVRFISNNQALLVLLLITGLITDMLLLSTEGARTRTTNRELTYADVLQTVIAVAIIAITVLIWVSITTTTVTVVATSTPNPNMQGHVELGAQETLTLSPEIADTPGFHRIIEAEGATVREMSRRGRTVDIVVEVGPYREAGRQTFAMQYAAYPATLPSQMIEVLHHIHPLVAAFATASAPLLVLYVLLRGLLNGNVPVNLGTSRTTRRLFD